MAEDGVFGEIGGDSNATFNSCCLQEKKERKSILAQKNLLQLQRPQYVECYRLSTKLN